MTNLEIDAFLTVCRKKTISKAAEELYISQSSLSTRLRTLEEELGYRLFLRQKGGREVELTAEGKQFYGLAMQYQEIVRKMFDVKGEKTKLRVSSINSVGTYLLPPVYERFVRMYPDIPLEIQDMEVEMACRKILRGETDLAFTTESRESARIDAFPVLTEPMALVCSADSDYPDVVEPQMLSVKNEVYIAWCPEYVQWHSTVFGADDVPKIRLEIMSQLRLFTAKKDSWAIVPVSVAEGLAGDPTLRRCRMAFYVPERTVYALCAHGTRERRDIARFLLCIREEHFTFQNKIFP